MSDDEVREVLEQILALAASIGFSNAMASNSEGDLVGIYLGVKPWIDSKTGVAKITH